MRVARDFGDMSLVVPDGYDGLGDAPHDLVENVGRGLMFLSWLEELPKDEQPPRRIWLDPERLDNHFREVEKARRKKYGLPEQDTDEWVENPLADELVVG